MSSTELSADSWKAVAEHHQRLCEDMKRSLERSLEREASLARQRDLARTALFAALECR